MSKKYLRISDVARMAGYPVGTVDPGFCITLEKCLKQPRKKVNRVLQKLNTDRISWLSHWH